MSKNIYASNPASITAAASTTATGLYTVPWTGTSATNWTLSPNTYTNPMTVTQKATVELNGDDADVIMNGASLKEFMGMVNERLAWLVPNPELEKEFEELKELSDAYRKLEAECKEKMKVWNILKDKNIDK